MYFRFSKKRRGAPRLETPPVEQKQQEEAIGLIQGLVPDSKQEWWIAQALNMLKLPYTYQYPVNGGRARGGYMIDFVVNTVPLATPIEPIGNHWHTGELGADDKKRLADIEELTQAFCRPVVLLWIPDLLDLDTVYQKLKRDLV